jgi:hypothetical protein
MNNEDRKEKFSGDQKKKKEVNIGVKIGRGNLTFGADARVEFNSSSLKSYRYMNKGECCPKPIPKPELESKLKPKPKPKEDKKKK